MYGADNIRKRFTGYEKDTETGLDFAEARYYQNKHGRFTAVDPLLASGKSANPQTFNRYAYVLGNPLRLTDHSGLQAGSESQKYWFRRVDDSGATLEYRSIFQFSYKDYKNDKSWQEVQYNEKGEFTYEGIYKKNVTGDYILHSDGTGRWGNTFYFSVSNEDIYNKWAQRQMQERSALFLTSLVTGFALGKAMDSFSPASNYGSAAAEISETEGTATVTASFPKGNMHFSIETEVEEGGLATGMGLNQRTGNGVVREIKSSDIMENVAFDKTFRLPNARAAMQFQQNSLGNAGRYNYFTNSCLTHVCGTLRAGGMSAPRTAFEASKLTFRAQASKLFGRF